LFLAFVRINYNEPIINKIKYQILDEQIIPKIREYNLSNQLSLSFYLCLDRNFDPKYWDLILEAMNSTTN
jgi:hypothetical protein